MPKNRTEAPYAYDGLDRIMHEKARLGIMTSLLTHPEGLVFGELKDLCALTDGNLSRHLSALAQAGLVSVWKGFERNRPKTLTRLTPDGRKRFLEYIDELQKVVEDAAHAESSKAKPEKSARFSGRLAET
jgi:DNA-binding MarR family transcriptional regulator